MIKQKLKVEAEHINEKLGYFSIYGNRRNRTFSMWKLNRIEASFKLKFRMRYITLSKFVFSYVLIYGALNKVIQFLYGLFIARFTIRLCYHVVIRKIIPPKYNHNLMQLTCLYIWFIHFNHFTFR